MEPIRCPKCGASVETSAGDDVLGVILDAAVVKGAPPQYRGSFVCRRCGETGTFIHAGKKVGMAATGPGEETRRVTFSGPNDSSFDPPAQKVLSFAREEAHSFGHTFMETEHLMLALLRSPDEAVVQFFRSLGLEIDVVRQRLLSLLGETKPASPSSGPLPVTLAAARVLYNATTRAQSRGRRKANSADLLVSLVDDPRSIAAAILDSLSVPARQLRQEIDRLNDQA